MQNIQISLDQARNYIILINIFLGFLFGVFPLLSGIKMNNRKYGIYGFVGAIVGGAILGVFLSFPMAAIFTWLILKKPSTNESANVVVENGNAAGVKTDTAENG